MNRTPKTCPVCSRIFQPAGNSQKRCAECNAAHLIEGPRPLCACGCGEGVTANHRTKNWNTYVLGHAVRVKHPRGMAGKQAWNKGNVTRYDFFCDLCAKPFRSKLKEAKFCSRECYAQAIRGNGSPHWNGGQRTKYQAVRRNGRMVKLHRLVMEGALDRQLTERECVHHIDGNGQNNAIENLHLFHCESCHQTHHHAGVPLAYIYGEAH